MSRTRRWVCLRSTGWSWMPHRSRLFAAVCDSASKQTLQLTSQQSPMSTSWKRETCATRHPPNGCCTTTATTSHSPCGNASSNILPSQAVIHWLSGPRHAADQRLHQRFTTHKPPSVCQKWTANTCSPRWQLQGKDATLVQRLYIHMSRAVKRTKWIWTKCSSSVVQCVVIDLRPTTSDSSMM